MSRPWLVCLCFGLFLSACPERKGPSYLVRIAGGVVAGGVCDPANPDAVSRVQAGRRVRISVRRHAPNDVKGEFLCDRVVDAGPSQPFLDLPHDNAASLDYLIESFVPDGMNGFTREGVGSLFGVPPTNETPQTVVLFPVQSFRCGQGNLARGRSFHTATLLPTGHVVVLGGLALSPTDGSKGSVPASDVALYLLDSAEIWDPADGQWKPLSGGHGPRAFHHAFLLDEQGPPYRIALVGGITTDTPDQVAVVRNNGSDDGARLVVKSNGLTAPPPARPAAAVIVQVNPTERTLTMEPLAGPPAGSFQAAARVSTALLTAGGIAYSLGSLPDLTPARQLAAHLGGGDTRMAMLANNRSGAAAVAVDNTSAVVWGGVRVPGDPPGELISNVLTTPAAAPLALAAPEVQFPTATPVPGTRQVVITGGFTIEGGSIARHPPPAADAAKLLDFSASPPTVTALGFGPPNDCSSPERYRPAGYASAIALPVQGQVLITGGAPSSTANAPLCVDCDSSQDELCASTQAVLFEKPASLRRVGSLQLARHGHTSTLLPDGNVMIVGGQGVTREGAQNDVFYLRADVEVYNPRPAQPRFDAANPAAGDPDDPLVEELRARGLTRAPGAEAATPGSAEPAARCNDL